MTQTEEMKLFEQFKSFMLQQDKTKEPNKRTFNRRPRGTGSIYSLGKNRKKPFAVSVTIGKNPLNGKPIKKLIGTFKTREEAETQLSIYNLHIKGMIPETIGDKPFVNKTMKTFAEIWEEIYNSDISKLSDSSIVNYKSSYNNLKPIHHLLIDKINMHTLQPIFDELYKNGDDYSKLNRMKVVVKKVFDYALKYDYVDKDYASFIKIEKHDKEKLHKPFTNDEIKKLWELDTLEAHIILIYIYSGVRPSELIEIKTENIHIDKGYMIGGIKTSNGKNRIIPIHNAIMPFIKELMSNNYKYLVYDRRGKNAYNDYRVNVFQKTNNLLNFDHTPHDTRHTFATLCSEHGLNDYLAKKIIGHSCNDLTKDVYTHASIERLVSEVNKIPLVE